MAGNRHVFLIRGEGYIPRPFRAGLLIFLPLVLFSCATRNVVHEPALYRTERVPSITGEGSIPFHETETHFRESYLTIVAAGDNLFHDVMIRDGEEGNFEPIYREIQPLVQAADIAFINQETLLAGKDYDFSGYPRFNSPQKIGRAIAAAGFNVINHATNHIMDKGEKAITATLDFWDTINRITVLGIHRSEEERSFPVLIVKNNITIGFLGYTYGTNGIPVPREKPFLVSLINTEIMEKEIDALRPLCDFLVVSMHWGDEYNHNPVKEQENFAAFLAEHRVDLVIGHHPHVLQSIEYILRPDGRFMLCFYSLGNLVSAQTQNPTLLGALAYIRIKKTGPAPGGKEPDGIIFMDAGAIPIVTHYEKDFTEFKVYPLYDYSDELLDKHWKNQGKKELTMDYLSNLSAAYLKDKEILFNPFKILTAILPVP